MGTTVSKVQKLCIFAGAALLGCLNVAAAILAIRNRFGRGGIDREFDLYLTGCVFFSCTGTLAIVLGSWIGGGVSGLWRSPPGKSWFLTLSMGIVGGFLGTGGAMHWIVHDTPAVSNEQFRGDTITAGAVILIGTLAGLLGGFLIARYRRHGALTITDDDRFPPR